MKQQLRDVSNTPTDTGNDDDDEKDEKNHHHRQREGARKSTRRGGGGAATTTTTTTQHHQSDYVFRLLLSRQVHVAEFPATERFAYIEVFQLFMFYYAFAI